MNIAQISPLFESVPPKGYGGTERVVSYLTEELVRQGHNVTLFASGDSNTNATLISHAKRALRLFDDQSDPFIHYLLQMQDVIDRVNDFDILHFHTDYLHFPISGMFNKPVVTTLHGRLDLPGLKPVFKRFPGQSLISISFSQRTPLPEASWLDTIYHGLPEDLYSPGAGDGDYVAFIGRISREKGPDKAIEIAKRAGIKLKIAAKVDKADSEYFESDIKALLQDQDIEFIGEIGEDIKNDFLGKAKALLFPINWPEPFGMVMIEAMACGTPIIAYPNGSVPEVIEDGRNGYIVSSIEESVKALKKISLLDRNIVRQCFTERFSSKIMAKNYLSNYEQLIQKYPSPKYCNKYAEPKLIV
jgi:glycosyltransferase involved in cell wall biosynthesis